MSAPDINVRMGWSEWALLIILSVLWGGSFFFVEVAISALPPLTVVTLRVGLAAAALWLIVFATGRAAPIPPLVWAAFLGMGLLNNVIPFTLIAWGQTEIASGLASILNATTPLFTVLVAHLFLRDEPATPSKVVGVVVGFSGAVMIIGPSALGDIGASAVAQLAVLLAALSYAFAGAYGRRFRDLRVDPIVTAAGQVTVSAIVLTPVALIVEQPFALPAPSFEVWSAIVGLAVLSTAIAYVLYFRILATAGATNLLLVTFLIPASAILLGVLVLDEPLIPLHFAGLALIGIGLSAIDGRLWRRNRKI